MKHTKLSAAAGALLVGVLALSAAAPAFADPTPQTRDIVGGGSDTTQVSLNYLADGSPNNPTTGYNATRNARLVSYDAVGPSPITLKTGTAPVARPINTGTGINLLFSPSNPAANYARASSPLSQAQIDANLRHVPFAIDGIATARRAAGSNVPASLTVAQLADIYRGIGGTNWTSFGGGNGTIVPLLPFPGSGTRATFIAQLATAAGLTPAQFEAALAGTVVEVQEHDPAPIAANQNAIAPFSTGRAASAPSVSVVGGFLFQRALYNVVRQSDLSSPFFASIFGPNGFICSGAGKNLIADSGFQQLAHPDDGGACGVASTVALTAPFVLAP